MYNMKDHRNWEGENNFGCTHFGLHPDNLPRHMLRFNTFHMIMKITKGMISYIRNALNKHPFEIKQQFNELLSKNWDVWYVFVWALNKNLNRMKGSHIFLSLI